MSTELVLNTDFIEMLERLQMLIFKVFKSLLCENKSRIKHLASFNKLLLEEDLRRGGVMRLNAKRNHSYHPDLKYFPLAAVLFHFYHISQ